VIPSETYRLPERRPCVALGRIPDLHHRVGGTHISRPFSIRDIRRRDDNHDDFTSFSKFNTSTSINYRFRRRLIIVIRR